MTEPTPNRLPKARKEYMEGFMEDGKVILNPTLKQLASRHPVDEKGLRSVARQERWSHTRKQDREARGETQDNFRRDAEAAYMAGHQERQARINEMLDGFDRDLEAGKIEVTPNMALTAMKQQEMFDRNAMELGQRKQAVGFMALLIEMGIAEVGTKQPELPAATPEIIDVEATIIDD